MLNMREVVGFEWDAGNLDKSYAKHGITPRQSEEIFLDENLQIVKDIKHSEKENRMIAIGQTFEGKILFVVFILRKMKIRVVSARIANRKEREMYEEKIKKNPPL